MSSRYHVDTPANLALVQVALDQAFGLRDPAGNPTPREQMVHKPGLGLVPASVALGPLHGCYDQPGRHWPMVDGGDGTAALAIAELASIDAKLGRTVSGVALPTAASLVQVTRPRDHSRLPVGVRDKLDDAYIDGRLNGTDARGQARDTPEARAEIAAELQGRAAAAIARRSPNSKAALERTST